MSKIVVWLSRGDVIGDSVRDTSLFEHFAEKYGAVDVICSPLIAGLYKNNPYVNKIHMVPELSKLTSDISFIRKLYFYVYSLSKSLKILGGYNTCVITQNRFKFYGLLARLSGIRTLEFKHEVQTHITPKLFLDKDDLFPINLPPKKNIVINIESKDPSRCWPKENYSALITLLSEKYNIILVGTSMSYNKSIINKFNKSITNLVGMTNIRQTASIIQRADLYIGNDSGLSHIAAAVGTDILNIMVGSTVEIVPNGCSVSKLNYPCVSDVVKEVEKHE